MELFLVKPMGRHRTRWLSQVMEHRMKRGKTWQEMRNRRTVGRKKRLEIFSPTTHIKQK
jgi:hypothetical protein